MQFAYFEVQLRYFDRAFELSQPLLIWGSVFTELKGNTTVSLLERKLAEVYYNSKTSTSSVDVKWNSFSVIVFPLQPYRAETMTTTHESWPVMAAIWCRLPSSAVSVCRSSRPCFWFVQWHLRVHSISVGLYFLFVPTCVRKTEAGSEKQTLQPRVTGLSHWSIRLVCTFRRLSVLIRYCFLSCRHFRVHAHIREHDQNPRLLLANQITVFTVRLLANTGL